VDAGEVAALEPEVRDWEPRQALVADGQTEALIGQAAAVLVPGGAFVLECHEGRAQEVAEWMRGCGFPAATITADLAGRERVVEARWRS
jgi:release factor glutamine methyltransferase